MSSPATPERIGVPHTWLDDALGVFSGVALVSLGVWILQAGHLVTGGTAGLALLLTYVLPAGIPWLAFPVIFIVVNIPFLLLGWWKRDWRFAARSILTITAVSAANAIHVAALGHPDINPWYATIVGNILAGAGLLILFRHNSSLGGFTIVALLAQDRFGWRAGMVLMMFDATVVIASVFAVGPVAAGISLVGAALLSLIITLNHRPGRYLGS